MAGSQCALCGREEFLPFRCKLCGQPYCLDHRLPENHACAGLGSFKVRAAQQRVGGAPRAPIEVRVRGHSAVADAGRRASSFARRSATHLFLAVILGVFAAEVVGGIVYSLATNTNLVEGYLLAQCTLALGKCGPFVSNPYAIIEKPWGIVTNLFAHAGPFHLLFNVLFLYFFGTELERRVGRRTLTGLFFAAGIGAAVAQVALFHGGNGAVLGASGALMGILGTLTILAPTMRVLFWFVPIPLWIMTVIFVIFDLGGLMGDASGIANLAHLAGLAVGLAMGLRLRRRGVMPRITSPWAFQRRG